MTDDGNFNLAAAFERQRPHLHAVAYRMLGSQAEAEDAVQEAWLRLNRADASTVENLGGWLTTVVARLCLDQLRARAARHETPDEEGKRLAAAVASTPNPEQEAVMADAVGLALLVVLDRLEPAERLAFVLHDMFDIPFEQIASMVGRTPEAARQLASRARRRVRGADAAELAPQRQAQRRTVEAFLAALRAGDFAGVMAQLDPNFEVRATGPGAAAPGSVVGAEAWARRALQFSQQAAMAAGASLALIEGDMSALFAMRGQQLRALRFHFANGRIAAMEVITDPAQLRGLEVTPLDQTE